MKVNGGVIVLIGAISYGIPASIFKMATNTGILPANLLMSQVLFAALILICINYIRRNKISYQINHIGRSKLLLSGLAMASTNTLYFTSLQYVSVTISAVLLMQSVWIAMIFGIIFQKKYPSIHQTISVILIMIGTVLATQLLSSDIAISWFGILLAFGSACAYAAMIIITNSVVTQADPIQRAMYVSMGASFFLMLFWGKSIDFTVQWSLFKWGPIIAIFSVVLPLICFSKGMPLLSPSIGGIISSIELPSAILFAYILLNEQISLIQIIGIFVIIFAVAYPNLIAMLKKLR
jgi:drug/metabolite transporter (DMT)-like permease